MHINVGLNEIANRWVEQEAVFQYGRWMLRFRPIAETWWVNRWLPKDTTEITWIEEVIQCDIPGSLIFTCLTLHYHNRPPRRVFQWTPRHGMQIPFDRTAGTYSITCGKEATQ